MGSLFLVVFVDKVSVQEMRWKVINLGTTGVNNMIISFKHPLHISITVPPTLFAGDGVPSPLWGADYSRPPVMQTDKAAWRSLACASGQHQRNI